MGIPISFPIVRSLAILGLIIYFFISAYLINRYFNNLAVDKPVIIKNNDWFKIIKSNAEVFIVCSLSVVLHISPLFSIFIATGGGEFPYIYPPLRIYDSLSSYWYRVSDIPVQYLFWSIIVVIILIVRQKKASSFKCQFSSYKINKLIAFFVISNMFVVFSIYAYLFPFYILDEQLFLLRYPPVSQLVYLITYFASGFSYIGPRVVQLMFYILGAVYLYRTIYLFREKETALLGATIYLFSPIMFSYASRAAIESGVVLFMVLISFYFLRFIKEEDDRDLILASYFIGIGFMYKQVVLVMFIICFAYIALSTITKRDRHSIAHFKILLLSLVFVLPFFMIGKISGLNFYAPAATNLISFDFLFKVIQSQLSLILSFLFLCSIVYILFRRDTLSLFFGVYFFAYYMFYTLQLSAASQRYSMAFYPAIAVLLSQFISEITKRIKWKYTFRLVYLVLTIYLIFLCVVPRSGTNLTTFKYKDFESQYYPVDKATDWIRDMTGKDEKILALMMSNYQFYVERIYEDTKTLNPDRFLFLVSDEIEVRMPTTKQLKKYCVEKKVSYIMFPFSPDGAYPPAKAKREMLLYLKEDRDNDFIEVSKFNLEDNYIFIYKLKDINGVSR